MAIKILCLDVDEEIINVELYGKLMANIVSYIAPIQNIKHILMRVLEKRPNKDLQQIFDSLNIKVFEEYINKVKEYFKDSINDPKTHCKTIIKITGVKTKSNFNEDHTSRNKQESIIYWLKSKVSTAVDLARISFSRIQERTDQIFRDFKQRLSQEKIEVKVEQQRGNNIFLKISLKNMKRDEVCRIKSQYFAEENLLVWNQHKNYVYFQNEDLKKLSISKEECYYAILKETSSYIKECLCLLNAEVEKMF